MADLIRLTLPWPPSVNHYWRNWRGRMVISGEGRDYREAAAWSIRAAHANLELIGPLAVEILLHPPDRRRRDIDNPLKAILDAMQAGGVYQDDSQIKDLHLLMLEVAPQGKALVNIKTLEEKCTGSKNGN